jgi:hypothetical protein
MNAQRGVVSSFRCDCSNNTFAGVIQGKVDETQLKAMLEQINEKTEQKVKVTRARVAHVLILTRFITQVTVARRMNWDDSDDD